MRNLFDCFILIVLMLLVLTAFADGPRWIGQLESNGSKFISGSQSQVGTPSVRRIYPNDYWANHNFEQNFYTSDDSRFLSDGSLATGQVFDKTTWATWWINDEFMDLPRAWAITTGDTNIVIAISDIEVDFDHPDLQPNLVRNWGEHGGSSGVDDDNNGLIDDIKGWDFAQWDKQVSAPIDNLSDMDDWMNGASTPQHGTNMAGFIGAKGNNEPWGKNVNFTDKRAGSCGVLWEARIYPIRCLEVGVTAFDNSPHEMKTYSYPLGVLGNSNQHVEYLCWLKDEGVLDIRVLSMSWVRQSRYLVSRCIESGILPVTGSGNTSTAAGLNPIADASDSILVMGGVNAIGRVIESSESMSFGAGVDLCGWTNPTGANDFFSPGDWSPNPETYGWLPMDPSYTDNPNYFTSGFISRTAAQSVNINIKWEPNYEEPSTYPDYTVLYGVMPSPMFTSGAAAQGAGVAMLIFSEYPNLGPLQCKAMITRGASRLILDGRNVADCDGDCDGLIGSGSLNAYRALTLWGDVSDTTISGTVYVSGDVNFGDNVIIAGNTIFKISPEDIYTNEIDPGGWLDCEAQYEIVDVLDNKPVDLTVTTEIFISGTVATTSGIVFESFAQRPNSNDWGGIWVQIGGSINAGNITVTGTTRGDYP